MCSIESLNIWVEWLALLLPVRGDSVYNLCPQTCCVGSRYFSFRGFLLTCARIKCCSTSAYGIKEKTA